MDIHDRALGFVGKELVYRPIDFERYRKPHVIEYPRHAVVLNPHHTRQHREEMRKTNTSQPAHDEADDGSGGGNSDHRALGDTEETDYDEGDPRGLTVHDYLCTDQTLKQCMRLRWRHVRGVGRGLCNLGNTCFANAVLQALAYTPALSQYFAEVFVAPDRQVGCPYDFAYALGETMRHMQPDRFGHSGKEGSIRDGGVQKNGEAAAAALGKGRRGGETATYRPALILAHLHTLSSRFRLGRQSDAHEFLTQLLSACQKSILFRHVGSRKLTLLASSTTALRRMCGGFLRSQVCWRRAEEVQQLLREGKKQEAVDLEMEAEMAARRCSDGNKIDNNYNRNSNSMQSKGRALRSKDEDEGKEDAHSAPPRQTANASAKRCKTNDVGPHSTSPLTPRGAANTPVWEQLHSNTYDPFTTLSVELAGHTLEHCLAKFFAIEVLAGRCYCTPREVMVHATKQFLIHVAPPVLIIHLKRFGATGQKMGKYIEYPSILHVDDFTTESQSDSDERATGRVRYRYELSSICVHEGNSIHYGHYYAVVRASNGLWYECNDSHVSPVGVERAMKLQAYMLFYSRVDTTTSEATKEKVASSSRHAPALSRNHADARDATTNGILHGTSAEDGRDEVASSVALGKRKGTWPAPTVVSHEMTSDEVGTELSMEETQELLRTRAQQKQQHQQVVTSNVTNSTSHVLSRNTRPHAQDADKSVQSHDTRGDTSSSDRDENEEEAASVSPDNDPCPQHHNTSHTRLVTENGLAHAHHMPRHVVQQLTHHVARNGYPSAMTRPGPSAAAQGSTRIQAAAEEKKKKKQQKQEQQDEEYEEETNSPGAGADDDKDVNNGNNNNNNNNNNLSVAPSRLRHGIVRSVTHRPVGESAEANAAATTKRRRGDEGEVVHHVGWSAAREVQRRQKEELPATVRRPTHAPKFQQTIRDAMWEMEMDKGRLKKVKAKKPPREDRGGVNPFQEVASSKGSDTTVGRSTAVVPQTHEMKRKVPRHE